MEATHPTRQMVILAPSIDGDALSVVVGTSRVVVQRASIESNGKRQPVLCTHNIYETQHKQLKSSILNQKLSSFTGTIQPIHGTFLHIYGGYCIFYWYITHFVGALFDYVWILYWRKNLLSWENIVPTRNSYTRLNILSDQTNRRGAKFIAEWTVNLLRNLFLAQPNAGCCGWSGGRHGSPGRVLHFIHKSFRMFSTGEHF